MSRVGLVGVLLRDLRPILQSRSARWWPAFQLIALFLAACETAAPPRSTVDFAIDAAAVPVDAAMTDASPDLACPVDLLSPDLSQPDFDSDPHNCGSIGHDCLGGGCAGGAC